MTGKEKKGRGRRGDGEKIKGRRKRDREWERRRMGGGSIIENMAQEPNQLRETGGLNLYQPLTVDQQPHIHIVIL